MKKNKNSNDNAPTPINAEYTKITVIDRNKKLGDLYEDATNNLYF